MNIEKIEFFAIYGLVLIALNHIITYPYSITASITIDSLIICGCILGYLLPDDIPPR